MPLPSKVLLAVTKPLYRARGKRVGEMFFGPGEVPAIQQPLRRTLVLFIAISKIKTR